MKAVSFAGTGDAHAGHVRRLLTSFIQPKRGTVCRAPLGLRASMFAGRNFL